MPRGRSRQTPTEAWWDSERRILEATAHGWVGFNGIQRATRLAPSTLSAHLERLVAEGKVLKDIRTGRYARTREGEAVVRGEMMPRFRNGDAAGAVLLGTAACARRLLGARVTVASPAADPALAEAASLPGADDPLPSTAVPDPQADAAGPVPRPPDGSGLLLGMGVLCGGLFAAWLISAKLLYSPSRPRRRARSQLTLTGLDPTLDDATGTW